MQNDLQQNDYKKIIKFLAKLFKKEVIAQRHGDRRGKVRNAFLKSPVGIVSEEREGWRPRRPKGLFAE